MKHVVVSTGLGAGLYLVHPDPLPATAAFSAGVLVDLDHFFDLWVYQKHREPGERLFEVFQAHYWVKSYIFLHALEFLPILLLMTFLGTNSWLWAGLALGYGCHLLMDILGNNPYPGTYFFSYRLHRKFYARYFWKDSRPRANLKAGT